MKILVTGGLGVVGRPLVLRLLGHGHTVRVLDRTNEQSIDGAECVTGDVTDFTTVRKHVQGMEAVVHLAALTYPAAGPGHEIFRINCAGTYNLYEAAAQEGIRRVVCASSINALGYNFGVKSFPIQYLPMDEAHPTYTTDAYSFSKQTTEEIAAYYWRREGISGVQLRLPMVYPMMFDFREMYRKSMAQTQQALQEFIQQPEAQQRERVQRFIAQQESGRALRLMEKPWDERSNDPDAFAKMDPLAMVFFQYTNFWSAIHAEDSAQAFENGVLAEYEGSHPLYVCEDQNTLGLPSALLAKLFFPGSFIKHPLVDAQNLVSFEKAHALLGFSPVHHMREWLNAEWLNPTEDSQ